MCILVCMIDNMIKNWKFQKQKEIDKIQEYLNELNCNYFTGQYFYDKQESTGWVVGTNKSPMKDWKATIRTWIANENKNKNKQKTVEDIYG